MENGLERGNAIREKVNLICDLLSSEARLHQERAEAYEYRKKFYPGAGPTAEQAGITNPAAAFGGAGFGPSSYGGGSSNQGSGMGYGGYGAGGGGSGSGGYDGPGLGQTSN